MFTGIEEQEVIDQIAYVSPVVIAAFLLLSRILKLCKWHKAACIIPLLPIGIRIIDSYVVCLDEVGVMCASLTLSAMIIILLVAAYNVFFK